MRPTTYWPKPTTRHGGSAWTETSLHGIRPDQHQTAPGQHRRHARRRRNRGAGGPEHRSEHNHVTERKASLLIDTARAFLQWGKHEKAYMALRAAEQTANEEVAGRPAVHRLVRELITSAPPTVRRDAEQFASQIGVSR